MTIITVIRTLFISMAKIVVVVDEGVNGGSRCTAVADDGEMMIITIMIEIRCTMMQKEIKLFMKMTTIKER